MQLLGMIKQSMSPKSGPAATSPVGLSSSGSSIGLGDDNAPYWVISSGALGAAAGYLISRSQTTSSAVRFASGFGGYVAGLLIAIGIIEATSAAPAPSPAIGPAGGGSVSRLAPVVK